MPSRVFSRLTCKRTCGLSVLLVSVLCAAHAQAAPCTTARIAPHGKDRAHVLVEAEAYAAALRYPEARAMFRWMLARNPKDRDARFAVAKLDAWERCFEAAATGYRMLLKASAADLEARAGFVDMLLWDGNYSEARAVLDAGLRLEPERPELWARHARLLLWSGDVVRAVTAADHAEALAPNDTDLRAWRDTLFLGQLRAGLRAELYPSGYPDIYTASLSGLQRWKRFDFTIDAQGIDRIGGIETKPIIDGRYAAGAVYRASGALSAGLSLGFGAPSHVVPKYEARASIWTSFATRWSASISYAIWEYRDHILTAHILAPAIGYALTDDIQLEARAWFSYLVLRPPYEPAVTKPGVAAGVRGIWHALTPLRLMLSYTYGPQFDQTPGSYAFLSLESHIFGLSADWLIQRGWGLLPAVGFERRLAPSGTVALIYSAELSSYLRW
jgi:tetratricopeptide (TPR) repeat protein